MVNVVLSFYAGTLAQALEKLPVKKSSRCVCVYACERGESGRAAELAVYSIYTSCIYIKIRKNGCYRENLIIFRLCSFIVCV